MKTESIGRILLGAATGTAFGFLLHKGRATEHEAIAGQLGFRNATVAKLMATASAVGALGFHGLRHLGLAHEKVKPLNLGGIALGGTLFGAGMAILGFCPGTNMAALGAGHRDARAGALGMLAGALAFLRLRKHLRPIIEMGSHGEKTLPQVTHTSPWLWTFGMAASVAAGAAWLERRGR